MKVVENSSQNISLPESNIGGHAPKPTLATSRSFAACDMPFRGMYTQNPIFLKVAPPPLE